MPKRDKLKALISGLDGPHQDRCLEGLFKILQDFEPDDPDRITAERNLVELFGLYAFVRLAWHLVEPGTEFVPNWHIPIVCRTLEKVSRREIRKILFLIPPGCMKSLLVSTFWPAWRWIDEPGERWLFGSYAQDVADKNAKLHRDIVADDWFTDRWPSIELDKKAAKKVRQFENNFKGVRYSRGINASTTGIHANTIVYDDLVNAKDARGRAAIDVKKIKAGNQWWFGSAISRQANPKTTAYVGIQQRMHYLDTAALCIEKGYEVCGFQMHYDPEWEHNHPDDPRTKKGELLWPNRYGEQEIEDLRAGDGDEAGLSEREYEAQYQQNPAPTQGTLFRDEHFLNVWDPETLDYTQVILTVDCSFKDLETSDWVVIQAWGKCGKKVALLNQWRGKWDISATVDAIKRARLDYPSATIHVEDKANGPGVVQLLSKQMGMVREWSPGRDSKQERASQAAFVFDCGDVLFPPDALAPWMPEYRTELLRFPVAAHDDQVDATAMGVIILTEKGLSILDAM